MSYFAFRALLPQNPIQLQQGGEMLSLTSLEPVIPQTHLDSVELRVPHAQVGIGDVRPAAANIKRMPLCSEDLKSTASRREIEVGGVSGWEIRIGAHGASRQFDVQCHTSGGQAGVPPLR